MNSQYNETSCRNVQNNLYLVDEVHPLNGPSSSFLRHINSLGEAARKQQLRLERKREAEEICQRSRLRKSDMKFWWNDSSLKHVTGLEKREAKQAQRALTKQRTTQRDRKYDNCQSNDEFGVSAKAGAVPKFLSKDEMVVKIKARNQILAQRKQDERILNQPLRYSLQEVREALSRQLPRDNAQFGPTLTIDGLEKIIETIMNIRIPSDFNVRMPDLSILTDSVKDLRGIATEVTGLITRPVEVEHRFGFILDPISNALGSVREIGWKGIIVDFIFFLAQSYLSGWKKSVVVTGLLAFIWSLRHFFNEVALVYELMQMTGRFVGEADNTQSVDNVEKVFAGAVTILCVALVALGLGKLPGGKTTNDLFNRLSRVGAMMTSIKMLKDFFSESVDDILDYIRTEWFGYTSKKLNEWRDYDSFCDEVEKLHSTDLEREIPGNLELKNQVDSLIFRGDKILKEIERLKIPPIQTVRFKSHFMYLDRVRTLVASGGGGMHAPRVPAQIFQFYGSTGIGKSELTSMLNACLLASQGFTKIEDFHRFIYYRDSSQERFDGYISQVQGVVIDDYGSRYDSVQNPNPEPLEVIRMSNGAVWKLDMPNLAEKGNTFFSAKWVILTSNQRDHKWDSLTNPEAVSRRIALKFQQLPHYKFAKEELINNRKVLTLDLEKVDEHVKNNPSGYADVWTFNLVDGKNKHAIDNVIKANLTFEDVAKMCVDSVKLAQERGVKRLNATNNMFLDFVKRFADAKKEQELQKDFTCANGCENNVWCQHVDNTQMEQEREQVKQSERSIARQVVDKTRTLIKQKQATKETKIYASSKAEMMAKTSAWCDYAFGGGGDPYKDSRGHRNYTSIHDRDENVSISEILPRDSHFKPTVIEKITGKTHINLAALVALNPDYVCHDFINHLNRTDKLDNPNDYSKLLGESCVVVPEKLMDNFTKGYATAMNLLLTYSGAGQMERLYLFKRLPESSLMIFNQVMHYWMKGVSFEQTGVEICPEHRDNVAFMSSVYAFMTKSYDFVRKYYQKASLWSSWLKTEFVFTFVRALGIVVASVAVQAIWSWMTSSPKQSKKKNNNESFQEKDKGSTTTNLESFQNKEKGAKTNNLESFQEKNKALPKGNVESYQEKDKGAAITNVESDNVEALSDQNAKEIQDKLMNNMYAIQNVDTQTTLGSVLFLTGRLAVTNRHIAMRLSKEIRIFNTNESYTFSAVNVLATQVPPSSKHFDKDLVLLEFPRHLRIHSDIRKYFMTKMDFSMHQSLAKVALVSHKNEKLVRYGQSCVAFDRPFDLTSGGVTTMIRETYGYDIETVRGDCGAVLIAFDKNFERKIVGIHMAAGTGIYTGVSVAIHLEFLNELQSCHQLKYPESSSNGQCNIPNKPTEKCFDGNYLPLGKVESIYQPLKTNIRPSPLYGKITEPTTAPARLSRFVKDGEIVDPFVNARKKALTESVEVDDEILARSVNHYSQIVQRNINSFDQRILTHSEAIEGIENEETYLPIKRNTSPGGLPSFHGWSKSGVGKRQYLDNGDGTYKLDHPLVLEKTNQMLEKLKRGERSDTVWIDTLKDERRTIAKVEAGKTRLFAAGELAFLILFRRYFFGFASHMMRNRIENESCVGINPYSQEWSQLGRRIQSKGKAIIAGDFTNYDGTLSATILWSLLDIIEKFYQGTEEDKLVRRTMWLDIVNSVHVSGDNLYVWSHSQPSGCPITALLNSLYHSVSARYVYIVCARKYAPTYVSLQNFERCVVHNNYGDDDLWNISDEIVSWFNQVTISEAYTTIGMTYTDELKTGEIVATRSLDEVQFLKRKFRYDRDQSRYRCPLALETILEMAMWMHGTKNVEEITRDTLKEAVYELSHHEEKVFNEHFPKFEYAATIVPTSLSTYSEYQEQEYYRYVV